jgi:signal transduction histidine kinase
MRAAVGDRETFVLVSVSDTGAGLTPADLQRIFHPFEQGGNTAGREKSGTGLGLALTREMAELHGGLIRAESGGLGQGATFSIALPVAVDHPARPAE